MITRKDRLQRRILSFVAQNFRGKAQFEEWRIYSSHVCNE